MFAARRATLRLVRGIAALLALSFCVGGAACSKKEKEGAKAGAGRRDAKHTLRSYIRDDVPKRMTNKLDADFDGKLTLLGYRLDPANPEPGKKAKLTLYWKSIARLDKGFQHVTEVLDGTGKRLLALENGPLRKRKSKKRNALPPSDWDPGKIYIDEVVFKVPAKAKTDGLKIVTSVARKKTRLAIASGENDGENRVLVATLGVAASSKALPLARLDRLDAATKIKLDGKLDDAAWETAPSLAFVDLKSENKADASRVRGQARLLWNGEGLFLGVEVIDKDVVGGFATTDDDPPVWNKDAIELVVDPEGDNKDYYDVLINPQNLVFDARFDDYEKPKTEPGGPFGHQDWSSNVKSKVVVDGTLDKSDDEDKGYTVEALVPWKSFDKVKTTPPAIGDEWRLNLYAVTGGGAVGWSPVLDTTARHRAARFGRVLFAEKGFVQTAASAAPVTAPSGKPPGASKPAASTAAPAPKAPLPSASGATK